MLTALLLLLLLLLAGCYDPYGFSHSAVARGRVSCHDGGIIFERDCVAL